MRNNVDWLRPIGFLDFLRDVGKHFTVNYMMAKESVKRRLDGARRHQLHRVQLSAAAGLRLPRAPRPRSAARCRWAAPTSGATSPPAAIWCARCAARRCTALVLAAADDASAAPSSARPRRARCGSTPARTSPFRFYQFWLNTDDRDVGAAPASGSRSSTTAEVARDRRPRTRPRRRRREAQRDAGARRDANWCTATRELARAERASQRAVRRRGWPTRRPRTS